MKFRKVTGKLHLWLGIPSGLIVFVIAITGCLYSFQEEIQNLTQDFRYVGQKKAPQLPPSRLLKIAQAHLPDKLLHSIRYNEAGKAAEAIFYHYEPTYYYTIYMNPYTGEVLNVINNEEGFFRFVLNGHFYFWLPPDIGQPFVAISTLVFVILLITGIILWLPGNLKSMKNAFLFIWKKNTRWKRKNYDIHNILGFYACFIALIIAITGLVWGFQWFASGAYNALGGEKSLVYSNPSSSGLQKDSVFLSTEAIDKAWQIMVLDYPNAKSIEVHPPENDSASIAANANLSNGTYWKTDYRYFDRYTLEEIPVNHIFGRLKDANFADKMLRMNYDIHVGAIGGIAGKILVFLTGLIVASLPVTGYIIWLGKGKKLKNTHPNNVS